jgi:hypothetical protein
MNRCSLAPVGGVWGSGWGIDAKAFVLEERTIMNRNLWLTVVLVLGVTVQAVCGAALPGSITRDTLVESYSLARWSVGLNAEALDRDIDVRGRTEILEAQSLSLFLGYDILPWLTVYGTGGAAEARPEGADDWGSAGPKWSLGVNANIWQFEVLDPSFLAGLLTLKTTMEVGWYDSDFADGQIEWREFLWAIPLGYELHERDAETIGGLDISLAIYAAPAISTISGDIGTPFGGIEFDEEDTVGLIAGADLFLARNVSLGMQVQYFGGVSLAAAARYHF